MSNSKKIGIWGPSAEQASQPTNSPAPIAAVHTLKPHRRIRWGIPDVIWGFVLLIAFQVLVSAIIIANSVGGAIFGGTMTADVDTDTLVKSLEETAYTGPFLFMSAVSMYIAWGLVIRRASKRKGLGAYSKDFWLRFNWKRDLIIGVIFAIVVRLAEQGLTLLLQNVFGLDLTDAGNTDPIISQQGIWYVINALFIAALAAPFFEELFFRGLFMQSVRRFVDRRRIKNGGKPTWISRKSKWISIIVSSTIFGFMHFQGAENFAQWFVVIQTGLIGVILALIVYKTKRLGTAISAHVFFNLSGVILATLLAK